MRWASSKPGRPQCRACARPARVCVCEALPAGGPLLPETSLLLLQHPREPARALNSASVLQLCVDASRLSVVAGRSLGAARRSEGWLRAMRERRTPLLLFPRAGASEPAAIRDRRRRGERFLLVVIDGTWSEAREMLQRGGADGGADENLECLDLGSAVEGGGVGVYGGCRKPVGPGCFSTLEAVAMALRELEADGDGLAELLMRPLLKQVDYQMVHTNGQQTHHTWRPGYVPDLHVAAEKAAERAGVVSGRWEVTKKVVPASCQQPLCTRRGCCVCGNASA